MTTIHVNGTKFHVKEVREAANYSGESTSTITQKFYGDTAKNLLIHTYDDPDFGIHYRDELFISAESGTEAIRKIFNRFRIA